MSQITFKGNTVNTEGNLPEIGSNLSNFELVATDLSVKTLADFSGQNLVLNIFPSIDTGICAMSVRKFNKEASKLSNTKVLCISKDLPFAQNRFCGAEGLENVVNLSDFREGSFGKNYGLTMTDGPLQGLHARVVIVANAEGKVIYTELVPEIAQEPNYENALASL